MIENTPKLYATDDSKEHQMEDMQNIRVWARITRKIDELLEQRAKDEGLSRSAIINKALILYLTKDTMDESLLLAKMSNMQKTFDRLEKKIDVKQKLDLEWYQYFFFFAPDTKGLTDEQMNIKFRKANNDVIAMLTNFRNHEKHSKPFLEAIFGNMLEEDVD